MRMIILAIFLMCLTNETIAQRQVKDTSKAMKRSPLPQLKPEPGTVVPLRPLDSLPATRPELYKPEKGEESYQNRGAEDRRNPASDPNVIPNKRAADPRTVPDTLR